MKCPACSSQGPDDSPECAKCGVIFSKWKAREERAVSVDASPKNMRKTIGAVLIALLMIFWVWNINRALNNSRDAKRRVEEIKRKHAEREQIQRVVQDATRIDPNAVTEALAREAKRNNLR